MNCIVSNISSAFPLLGRTARSPGRGVGSGLPHSRRLLALQATAQSGFPELFAVPNNAKPPRTDQFSLGVRQRLGRDWNASVTLSSIRGQNGYTHYFANRAQGGLAGCCDGAIPNAFGYGNVLIGADDLKTRYKALYLTIDKNYTVSSGWGLNVATPAKGGEQRRDLFSLDNYTADAYGFRDRAGGRAPALVVPACSICLGAEFSALGSSAAAKPSRCSSPPRLRCSTAHQRDLLSIPQEELSEHSRAVARST